MCCWVTYHLRQVARGGAIALWGGAERPQGWLTTSNSAELGQSLTHLTPLIFTKRCYKMLWHLLTGFMINRSNVTSFTKLGFIHARVCCKLYTLHLSPSDSPGSFILPSLPLPFQILSDLTAAAYPSTHLKFNIWICVTELLLILTRWLLISGTLIFTSGLAAAYFKL